MKKQHTRLVIDIEEAQIDDIELRHDSTSLKNDVNKIIDQMSDGDDSGYLDDDRKWEIRRMSDGVDIDRRQQVAAAMLISGFDLPQPMTNAAQQMIRAAEICPGITTGELGYSGGLNQGRLGMLEAAQKLINEMISEAKAQPNNGSNAAPTA